MKAVLARVLFIVGLNFLMLGLDRLFTPPLWLLVFITLLIGWEGSSFIIRRFPLIPPEGDDHG